MLRVNEVVFAPDWLGPRNSRNGTLASSAQPVRFVVCHGQTPPLGQAGLLCPCRTPETFAATTYGPTKGPPLAAPTTPAGVTPAMDVSAIARSRFSRPLPVSLCVPAGSALRARRPTITSFVAEASLALSSAAAPATIAADAEVP